MKYPFMAVSKPLFCLTKIGRTWSLRYKWTLHTNNIVAGNETKVYIIKNHFWTNTQTTLEKGLVVIL